jgi:hypothetical protein
MNEFLEILKYILPSLVVFAASFYVIRVFLDHEIKELKQAGKDETRRASVPLRFQAYERIVLFLERINPENLVLRVSEAGMEKELLHSRLLSVVREEYEHNLAMQIYMSDQAWELVKNAKEEVLSDINAAAVMMDGKNSAADLGSKIIGLHLEKKSAAHDAALKVIKEEIREMF